MANNKKFFEDGEANEYFNRNKNQFELSQVGKVIELLSDWLNPFKNDISSILEIGCGSGDRLNQIANNLSANGYGVEPSTEAVSYIENKFPTLKVKLGFGDDIPFNQKFDLVHLGFFLYLVDRELYLRCISEADRLIKPGGFLSIIDFDTPLPYSNTYHHETKVHSHKINNSEVFVASGLFSVINKFHFSNENLFFDKDINERMSLTLLYKETDIFK